MFLVFGTSAASLPATDTKTSNSPKNYVLFTVMASYSVHLNFACNNKPCPLYSELAYPSCAAAVWLLQVELFMRFVAVC